MRVYQPREDSFLLADSVKKHAFGRVLDMGTGSGIQAKAALENKKTTSVTAADIDENCAGKIKNARIKFIHTDLFEKVPKQKFDAITFNPPYLPQDKGIEDKTIYGGKKAMKPSKGFLTPAATTCQKTE